MHPAVIGFRVKSGRATAVLLTGVRAGPTIIEKRGVILADPGEPESMQPFHAALDLPLAEGARTAARLVGSVERFARSSIAGLLESWRAAGHRPDRAAIVVASVLDPATIKNDHIRAHAEEGRLFRVVTEDGVRRCGVEPRIFLEKELFAGAARELRLSGGRLDAELKALGRGLGGPWRKEEKSAALAAWLLLES